MLTVLGGPALAQGESSTNTDTGLTLPELTVNVEETRGTVYVRFDTGAEWVEASEGQELGTGDQLRTVEASTATLKVPAIALVSVQESTNFEITRLNRLREEQGLILEDEDVTINEISLDVNQGELENSLKNYENVENDYRLKTPNAVAGVRGTTFECDVTTRRTECTVLEGDIAFANRFGSRREISLGELQRSRMTLRDTQPSSPESVDEEEVQDLEAVRERARKDLGLQPVLSQVSLNGRTLERRGQGVYTTTVDPREVETVELTGQARAQEPEASVASVTVRRGGEVFEPDGLQNWSLSLPVASLLNQSGPVTLVVQITDTEDNQSRAYPIRIVFETDQQTEGTLPPNLQQGDFAVSLDRVGDRSGAAITFPLELTSQDFLASRSLADTRIPARRSLVLRGSVDVDSPVEGVAYRFAGQEVWNQISNSGSWEFPLSLQRISTRNQVTLEVIAWTQDGYRSEITSFGSFRYDSTESVLPVSYSAGNVSVQLQSVAGQALSASDLPDSFTNRELGDQQLVVEGTAQADSPIEAVAYSLDGGRSWQRASGAENWSFVLPSNSSRDFTIQVIAWTQNNRMGSPLILDSINYRQLEQEGVLPSDYETGDVSVSVQTIADRPVSDLEFPYHLYQDDAAQEGIRVTGEASGPGTIEGVAYSLDGGETWERAEGGANWTLHIPANSSRTINAQIVAWTGDGVIGEPVELKQLEYNNSSYSTVLRNDFQDLWNSFSNKNDEQFFGYFSDDFEFIDSQTNQNFTVNGFDNFINDFYSGVRNLNVFFDVNQVLAGATGGEVQFSLEWRGKENDADRPFVMFGERSQFKYRRASNGTFEIISFEDFPLVLYLFNRRRLRIPDLDGVIIDTLEIVNKDDADVIAELAAPDFTVNKISIGGHISDGGIQRLGVSDFSSVESLPSLGSGYRDNVLIEEGRIYAMNVRDEFGSPSTGLLRVRDLASSFVEVQMISAQSPPGLTEDVQRSYRGIDPYE